MITSENAVFDAQFTDFFISWKSSLPFLIYSIFYNLNDPINSENRDVMMRISAQGKVHF